MTPQQVKKQFQDSGTVISDWAKKHGFAIHKVYLVLNGRTPAIRGERHEIAVALGIKPAPKQQKTHSAKS